MSILKFTGIAQARKRNTSYDIAVENGFVGDEQAYEIYTHGLTVAQVTLYKRASSAPNSYQTDGGTNVTYTFSNGNISFAGSDAGWHTSPYTDDGDLYVIYASASSKDTYDTILPSEWSIPAIMSEEAAQGEPGNNVCVVLIYNASATTPSLPSAETVFTFSTGDITGLTNGWVKSPPSGDKVWVSTAIAMSQEQSARISASAWSTPNIWKQKGDTGVGLTQPTEEYAVNNDSTNPPQIGWTTFAAASAQLDETHRFLWNKETMNYSDGTSSQNPSYHIVYRYTIDGTNAKNIKGIDEWYAYGTSSSVTGQWGQSSLTPSQSNPYVWQKERIIFIDDTYGEFATPHVISMWIKGEDGVSVTDIVDEYAVNNDDTTTPSSGWDSFDNVKSQLGPTNRFLWNRETVYYDGVPDSPLDAHIIYRVSTDGEDAKNITSVNEYSAYGSDSAPISPASKTDPDWSTNWGLTPKVPDATAGHHYVWQCEELVFNDNTTSALTTARRVAQYVEDGKDADVFDFTVSSQTYAKNLRVVNTNSIKVTVSLQGQYSSSTVTVKHDNTNLSYITKKNGTAVTPTSSISVADTDTLEVSIPMDVSFPVTIGMGSLEKVINCVDETEYGHNYGLLSTEPTVSSTPRLIFEVGKERDYYTSTADGNTYEYVGNSEWIESESTPKLLTGLTDILNDTTYDLNNYQDANNVSLFRRILAKQVIAEVLKALQLIIGTEGTGLYVNISEDPESNQRRFVVKFGSDTIFEINPTTGTTSMTNATVVGNFISSGFATQNASDTHPLQKSISTANRWKEEDFVAAAITQFNAHNSYFGSRGFYFSDTSGSLYAKDDNLATVSDTYTKIGAYTPYELSSVSYSTSLGSQIRQFGSWYFCYKNSSRRALVFVDSYYAGDQSAAAKKVAAAAYNEISNFNDYTCKPLAMPWYTTPMSSSQVASVSYGGTTTWACASHLSVYYYDFSTISLDTTNKAFTGTVTINSTVVVTATAQNKYYIRFNTDRDRIVISNSSQVIVYTISDYNNYSWALDINVEAGVEGIKARNVMPFDSSSSKVGTSALPFSEGNFTKLTNSQNSNSTVWGAVFN